MILFQVRDLAAKACGEPHVAPSWDIAKASLGAMLAKTPDLAERAHSIKIEYICEWFPDTGLSHLANEQRFGCDPVGGDVCLAEFRAACAREEGEHQVEADAYANLTNEERNHKIMLEHAAEEDERE